ncbi:MAG: TonB-dependent receptor [Phenylobacterium sp.]|uniref:TonB-dependent receptor n=1 Tax=Phenylobacterium sp. TaxID=1871053 RepID=UPI0025D24700|nr:TonB-dependent receptor [Phenylobacterium sp.]MBI1196694.1 TonB-dependent receptor [Phenylobacterium sp.]
MDRNWKRALLGATAASAALYGAAAQAADDAVSEVVVVGQRAMMASSIARQRASDTVDSVLTRDAIGQFPDQNVAEAVRRLPGVNVLDDQGEGRFIAVRGLDPTLNAASIDGVRAPSPEADTRAVALDVIPSELVSSITIKKTLTPDMDADTIGASIEIETTKGFDRKEPFLALSAEGSYNNLNHVVSPKAGVDFVLPVSDRFGIAGGFSYNRRKTSTDNTEMDGWSETSGGIVYADTLEYRDYDVTRKRLGGSLSFDFKASDATTLYARALYSQFDDTEKRGRLTFQLSGEPASGDANHATFLSDGGRIRIRRDLKDRFEGQKIQTYQVGGDTVAGDWTFDYKVAYSEAEEHEFNTQDPTRFQQDFKKAGQLAVSFDYTDLHTTKYAILAGETAFLDPSKYVFTAREDKNGLSKDKQWTVQGNAAYEMMFDDGARLQIKFGGKARTRSKTYDLSNNVYDGYNGSYTLADVAGGQSYDLAQLGPLPDLALVRAFNTANLANFELNAVDTAFEAASAFYDVGEDIYAGYLLGRYDQGPLSAIGGVRIEHTKDDVKGNLVETVAGGGTHSGQPVADDTVFVTPNSFSQTYTDVLPSLNLRYSAAEGVLLRGAVFRSVVRPPVGDIAPRFLVDENDDGDREGEFGNPDLKPYRAWNFDLSAEWYFAPNAVVQAGVFYKKIKNFVVHADFEAADAPYSGVFNGVAFDEALIPLNGDTATAKGVEISYQQSLTELPAPFDGLLVGLNYTYTDATGKIVGRSIPLPASSKNTFNAMLGYEKGPVSLRVAANYRDKYLDELGGSAETDRYVKSHLQWDITAKYQVTQRLQVYGELVNLGNEPYVAYQRGPRADRLLQFEEYSWTGKFGLRLVLP